MWARIERDRFQAQDPRSWMFRFHLETPQAAPAARPKSRLELSQVVTKAKPSGWVVLMTSYIGIIPQPIYTILLGLVASFVFICVSLRCAISLLALLPLD